MIVPKRFVSICARKSDMGVFDRREIAVSRVVDNNVQRAKRIDGCLHGISRCGLVGHI
jgi:hypothetical protein